MRTGELTDEQVAAYAYRAGWRGNEWLNIVAIVLGEHRGHPDYDELGDETLANSTWGPSVGLAQIRSLRSQYGTGGYRDQLENLDPLDNLRNARQVFAEQGWGAWSVTHGSSPIYESYLERARSALAAVTSGGVRLATGPCRLTPEQKAHLRAMRRDGASKGDIAAQRGAYCLLNQDLPSPSPGDIAGDIAGEAGRQALRKAQEVGLWAIAVGLGAALVVAGAWRGVQGGR